MFNTQQQHRRNFIPTQMNSEETDRKIRETIDRAERIRESLHRLGLLKTSTQDYPKKPVSSVLDKGGTNAGKDRTRRHS